MYSPAIDHVTVLRLELCNSISGVFVAPNLWPQLTSNRLASIYSVYVIQWRLPACISTYWTLLGPAILSFMERLCASIIEKGPQSVSFIERFFNCVLYSECPL